MSDWVVWESKGQLVAKPYQPGDDVSGLRHGNIAAPGVGAYFWRWVGEPESVVRLTTGQYLHDHFRRVGTA